MWHFRVCSGVSWLIYMFLLIRHPLLTCVGGYRDSFWFIYVRCVVQLLVLCCEVLESVAGCWLWCLTLEQLALRVGWVSAGKLSWQDLPRQRPAAVACLRLQQRLRGLSPSWRPRLE